MHQLTYIAHRMGQIHQKRHSLAINHNKAIYGVIPQNQSVSSSKKLLALARIRKRSMTLKQIKVDRYGQLQEDPPQKSKKQVMLLRDIIKRKEVDTIQTIQSQSRNRLSLRDYEYYDHIVRDLITQIKLSKRPQKHQTLSSRKLSLTPPASTRNRTLTKPLLNYQSQQSKPFVDLNVTPRLSQTFFPKQSKMVFRISQSKMDTHYSRKIATLIEFLFKICYSNSIFTDLSLSTQKKTYKVKIGPGNNCLLVKSLLKRRFWLEFTQNIKGANIVWTQDTQSIVHQKQPRVNSCVILAPTFKPLKKSRPNNNAKPNDLTKIMSKQDAINVADAFLKMRTYPISQIDLISNHIPRNSIIGSKKILFMLMKWYTVNVLEKPAFTFIPKSYLIENGNNLEIKQFIDAQSHDMDKVWIVKPGENTNRGKGILVMTTSGIKPYLSQKCTGKRIGEVKSYIVQQYLRPFLYHGRKFDIRHYLLVTSINGIIKGYWFKEGYIRTSSEKYDLDQLDNDLIHLTNDAIQKNGENYGKYEPGNKISYAAFQRYLDVTHPQKKYNFASQIVTQMKNITTHIMRAAFCHLDPQRLGHNFELFGMDFLVDYKFRPHLIQVNANPCLELSCPLLQRIIPVAVQHCFRIALDPLLPPPHHYPTIHRYHLSQRTLDRLHYELIFDEKYQGYPLREKYKKCHSKFDLDLNMQIQPEEDLFDDDGQQLLQNASLQ